MTRLALLLISLVSLMSCGRYNAGGQPVRPPAKPTSTPVPEGKRTTLMVFGAGFCGDCKADFPVINSLIAQIPEAKRKNLDIQLYYVSGDPGLVRPTQSAADNYKEAHFVQATAHPDLPWMWTNFKAFHPGLPLKVPSAVVLDEDLKVVKRYTAGKTTFVPSEIVAFVESRL